MDDLSLRVYLENGSDAMRGGWLELPVVPERLDAFMRSRPRSASAAGPACATGWATPPP